MSPFSVAPEFDAPFGGKETSATLPAQMAAIIETGKVPNALLLTGNPDTGRRAASERFFQALNCKKTGPDRLIPCNTCRPCKKILNGQHPDIITITPEKERIRIAPIREISLATAVKPHEALYRMMLIDRADTMTPEAANALLKILEEPPMGTFFVLLSNKLSSLLPTVISRCRHLSFKPISAKTIAQTLVYDYDSDEALATIAANLSDGSLKKARLFINTSDLDPETDWIKRREWLIKGITLLMLAPENKFQDRSAALFMAEKLGKEPELLADSMAVIRTWIRDIALFRFNPGAVINVDFSNLLKSLTEHLGLEKPFLWIKALHDTEKKMRANTVPRVTLEDFLLKLSSV